MLKATYRVKNSSDKTAGFIIDNSYVRYYDALYNIELIDNLSKDTNGVIKSKGEKLPVISITEVNQRQYTKLCKENALERDVQAQLKKWKDTWSKSVLYLTGARQIGKTTELLKFAYNNYEQIVYVNLSIDKSLQLFENLVTSNSMVFGLIHYCREARLEEFVDSPSTILIIDEIQESPAIYNSIRALQSELQCHVAVTGSFLGKTLNSKYFKPAGNLYEIEMLPLSFSEFCRAYHLEELLQNINLYGKSADEDYKKLTKLYNIYKQIGGYPAVVAEYKKSESIENCFEVIRSVIDRFTEESASYFKNEKCSVIFQNVSRAEVGEAVSWLKYSKIIGSCDLYNQGDVSDLLPERRFYFMDCGIANYIAKTTSVINSAVAGVLSENFAYTELYRLYKTGKVKGDIPCCSVFHNYELDFMIVDLNDKKIGIEVKTSNGKGDDLTSINIYLQKKFIDEGYLAGVTRGGVREKIKSIPIYTVGCRFPYEEEI